MAVSCEECRKEIIAGLKMLAAGKKKLEVVVNSKKSVDKPDKS